MTPSARLMLLTLIALGIVYVIAAPMLTSGKPFNPSQSTRISVEN